MNELGANLQGSRPVESGLSREAFVKKCSQGKKVATRIHGQTLSLFGRHVPHRTERGSSFGQKKLGLCFPDCLVIRLKLCKSEVEYLHLTAVRHENVLRFDISVNDAARVRLVQRLSHLQSDV